MFTKGHCSPRQNSENISCLSKKGLQSIAKVLNKEYKAKINLKQSKKRLFQQIKKVMEKRTSLRWKKRRSKISNVAPGRPARVREGGRGKGKPFPEGVKADHHALNHLSPEGWWEY